MRIAVWHNLPSGGGKRALYDHVRGLTARGHDVTAFCPPSADQDYLPLAPIVPEHVLPLTEPDPPPAPLRWLMQRAGASAGRLPEIPPMLAHAAAFAAIVERGDFDVVLASSCRTFYTPFVGRMLKIPSALYLNEPCRRLFEARPSLPWLAAPSLPGPWWHPRTARHWIGDAIRVHSVRVQAREEWTNIRAFETVLVNSRFSRESVLRAHGFDAEVCYLGVDTDHFMAGDDDREPVVLSVGEFGRHKNPLFVIRAVAATRRRPPLVWIANRVDEALFEEATRLAAALAVTMILHTNVSEGELVRHYQRAAVFAYAPRLEPFGFAPLEANACATPVVAVAEGGVRETVSHGETGLVVDGDHGAMAAALDLLLENPVMAREMGRSGARLVRRLWTVGASTDRLETSLLAIARNSRHELERRRKRAIA